MSTRTSPTVGIATCAEHPDLDTDGRRLVGLLLNRGVTAVPAVWDNPAINWSAFNLVVVRSTWDYPANPDAFLAWAARLPRVLNSLPVLRWNADKRYLADLATTGLPVVPTRFLQPGDAFEPPASSFVVKPSISCGCKDAARYGPGQAEALEHVQQLHRQGRTAMVQPYLAEVEEEGEFELVFMGGGYSHAVRRGALLTHGREDIRPYQATAEQLALAERVLGQVPGGPSQLLYGRVDLVPSRERGLLVMELELLEPSLFLEHGPGSAERIAAEVAP